MKKIALYTGKGAYMAKDVEAFLSSRNFDYGRLHEIDIQNGDLENYDILIIGGGSIFDFIPALGKKGVKQIRDFVFSGGEYVGICAGAYIAAESFANRQGKKSKGLGLVATQFQRGKGERRVEVSFSSCGEKINLYFCNGPLIEKLAENEELIAIDKSGRIGIIRKDFGKGVAYLFCAHPEGNLFKGITSEKLGSDIFLKKLLSN